MQYRKQSHPPEYTTNYLKISYGKTNFGMSMFNTIYLDESWSSNYTWAVSMVRTVTII